MEGWGRTSLTKWIHMRFSSARGVISLAHEEKIEPRLTGGAEGRNGGGGRGEVSYELRL